MSRLRPSVPSRSVLAVALVALLVATAGCGSLTGDGSGSAPKAQASNAPSDSDFLLWVDATATVENEELGEVADKYFSLQSEREYYDGPTSLDEALTDMEEESGLDPAKANEMLVFGDAQSASEYSGVIITGSWSTDAFVEAMGNQSNYEYQEETYNGHALYTPDSDHTDSAFAVLEEGKFVVGTEETVKDTVDVAEGDADAVSGDLKNSFTNTRSGFVRYAATVPQDQLPADQIGDGTQFDTSVFNDVETVSGAAFTGDDSVGLTLTMSFTSADSASNGKDILRGATEMYRGLTQDETAKKLLSEDNLSIEAEETDVAITSENPTSTLTALLEKLYGGNVGPIAGV